MDETLVTVRNKLRTTTHPNASTSNIDTNMNSTLSANAPEWGRHC